MSKSLRWEPSLMAAETGQLRGGTPFGAAPGSAFDFSSWLGNPFIRGLYLAFSPVSSFSSGTFHSQPLAEAAFRHLRWITASLGGGVTISVP